jgi:RNA-binding protein 39
MSALDVEALLDSTANATPVEQDDSARIKVDDRHKAERNDRRERNRDVSRDRDRDRKRRDRSRDRGRKDFIADKDGTPTSEHGSAQGSVKSRRRSRSRDDDRRHSRRHRDSPEEAGRRDGDFYRGGGRTRSRSRSPNRNFYRPRGDRRDRDDVDAPPRDDRRNRNDRRKSRSPKRESTPALTEDERDRRTVFVQQLAARLRTKELIAFFEKIGPVKEAQIVKDRVSGRSKGFVLPTLFISYLC